MRPRILPRPFAAWILGTASALVGCGGLTAGFYLAEDAPDHASLRRIVLLPMNYDHSPSPAIAAGPELLGARIRRFLEGRGFDVTVPRMSSTLRLWQACTRELGGIEAEEGSALDPERYEQARSELVRRTLEVHPGDGVVASTILVREGRYSGNLLRWDGAVRPAEIDAGDTNLMLTLRGSDFGTSLRTTVFDRRGRKVFERHVGLEPLRRYRASVRGYRIVPRKDLFQDEALLDEGVRLSFQPWLPPAVAEAP